MNHIPDTGKMVSETPRTDAEVNGGNSMGVLMGNGLRYALIQSDFARQLERELQEAQERIRLLIAERDSARQQAAQNWKLRDEFAALLGTDDVKEAVRNMQLMKEALECVVLSCDFMHHKKAHQHARGGKCIPVELVRMAKQISTTQTK